MSTDVVEVFTDPPTVVEVQTQPIGVAEVLLGPPAVVEIQVETTSVAEVLADQAARIEVVTAGPPGPPGPMGPMGPAGVAASYQHTQTTPATVWTISHGLGFDPAGIVVVSGGYQLEGFATQYLAAGQSLRLSFDVGVDGVAYLS